MSSNGLRNGSYKLEAACDDPPMHLRRRNHHKGDCVQRRFTCLQTTEDYFRAVDKTFHGTYGRVRRKLDYKYHHHYTKERQWLHDSIIEHFLQNECNDLCWRKPLEPWLILTVGVPGSGTRTLINSLIQSGKLPLLSYVYVDAYEIRQLLPEYAYFMENVPEKANELTSKECEYIAQTLIIAALQENRNVFFDSCLQSIQWYQDWIKHLSNNFGSIKVASVFVTADIDTLIERAKQESKYTSCYSTDKNLVELADCIPMRVQLLKKVVQFCFTIQNNDIPVLVDHQSWDEFTGTFAQVSTNGMTQITKEEIQQLDDLRMSKIRPKYFSVGLSTEENHSWDEMTFTGQFADIRESLDYSYHKNYNIDRQRFQDIIIHEFLSDPVIEDGQGEICTTPTEPWIVFTAGAMGAGKSYTLRKLVENNRFPLIAFVNVDPDKIRRKLPEFHLYITTDPESAGDRTRKEAGYISEILTLAALQAGKNVIVDGSLRDSGWYKTYFRQLRDEFANLKLAIIHITAPTEAVYERAENRAKKTGRVVPRSLLDAALEQVPKSVDELAPLVDYHVELHNAPNAADIELVSSCTWGDFTRNWIQTCAWIPSNKKRMQQKKDFVTKKILDEGD